MTFGKMGARRMMWSDRGWQNPYVTDGLVAMWDGEWNAGGGVHDPQTSSWVDLIGGNDFRDFATGVAFGKNYIRIPNLQTAAKARTLYPTSQISTLECRVALSSWDGIVLANFSSDNSNTTRWLGFRANNTFNFGHQMTCAQLGATANEPFSISGTISNGEWTLYKNGVISTPLGAGMTWGGFVTGEPTINATATSYPTSKIYSIRLYSRALTAAEVAANYYIDNLRFNLP